MKAVLDISVRPALHSVEPVAEEHSLRLLDVLHSKITPDDVNDVTVLLMIHFPRLMRVDYTRESTISYSDEVNVDQRIEWQTQIRVRQALWRRIKQRIRAEYRFRFRSRPRADFPD